MAWTQADIDALKDAMKSGARKVKYGEREVEYRSVEEMNALLGQMESTVNGKSGVRRIATRKGL